ncbi:MAG: LAGLIDADG family homing endonuclease [Patescibacteria group bacterium]
MAYVLGYVYADGTLINCDYIRALYLSITSTDKDSPERIKKMMGSEHNITKNKSLFLKGKTFYTLKIGNHKIYNDLIKHGLYPNKSLTVQFPNIPNKYLNHFIRGYFDGDGCIYFEKSISDTGKIIIKRIRTFFTSGSKIFLEKMNTVLANEKIENGRIYKSNRSFQLIFNNKDSIKLFKLMYKRASHNTFFMRKYKTFNDYFEARPVNIDKTVKKIIDFHKGHVAK